MKLEELPPTIYVQYKSVLGIIKVTATDNTFTVTLINEKHIWRRHDNKWQKTVKPTNAK